jgi:hypothetical protein
MFCGKCLHNLPQKYREELEAKMKGKNQQQQKTGTNNTDTNSNANSASTVKQTNSSNIGSSSRSDGGGYTMPIPSRTSLHSNRYNDNSLFDDGTKSMIEARGGIVTSSETKITTSSGTWETVTADEWHRMNEREYRSKHRPDGLFWDLNEINNDGSNGSGLKV